MKFVKCFKPLVMAAALAMAGSASAAAVPVSGEFGNTFAAGVVNDVWTFSLPSLSDISGQYGDLSAVKVLTSGKFKVVGSWTDFSFGIYKGADSVALNVVALPEDSDFSKAFSASNLGAGDYSIKITGHTIGTGASYIANLTVTSVPEPESYAMFLAGLGIMGFVARRRKNG